MTSQLRRLALPLLACIVAACSGREMATPSSVPVASAPVVTTSPVPSIPLSPTASPSASTSASASPIADVFEIRATRVPHGGPGRLDR